MGFFRSSLVLSILWIGSSLPAQSPSPAPRTPTPGAVVRDFYNVLLPAGADPWVVRHDGQYLSCASRGGAIVLTRSPYLTTLGAGETRVIHRAPPSGPLSKELWAPELHRLRGRWYVYYAADDGRNENHRMAVLECADEDPFTGEWVDRGRLRNRFDDHWAIDLTAFEHRGRLYAIWSGWEGDVNVRQDLYLAPMSDPLSISGPRVRIARPSHDWETIGDPDVAEGPTVIVRGDTVNVLYAASGSWTDSYCLGLLTARADADLLDPKSWTKRPKPLFRSGNGLVAPGHASVVSTSEKGDDWLIYHVARYPGAGWDRLVRAQPLGWSDDNMPAPTPLADPSLPLPLPTGEPDRRRIEAEQASTDGGARITPDETASGKAHVVGASAFRITLDLPHEGPYALVIRQATRGRQGARLAVFRESDDNTPLATLRLRGTSQNSGAARWSVVYTRLTLPAGPTTLVLRLDGDPTAIDCLDLVPLPSTPRPGE